MWEFCELMLRSARAQATPRAAALGAARLHLGSHARCYSTRNSPMDPQRSPPPAASPARHTTLGLLVTQRPARAELLQSLGLDYCCGGGRTLEKACIDQQLDVSRVLEQLASFDENSSLSDAKPTASPASNEDMSRWATPVLVSHILTTHHAYLKKNLPELARLAAKVESV